MQLLAAKQSNEDLKEGDKNIFIFFLSKEKNEKKRISNDTIRLGWTGSRLKC